MFCRLSKFLAWYLCIFFTETTLSFIFTLIGAVVHMSYDLSLLLVGFGLGFLIELGSFTMHIAFCFYMFQVKKFFLVHHLFKIMAGLLLMTIGISLYSTLGGYTYLIGLGSSNFVCLPLSILFFKFNLQMT